MKKNVSVDKEIPTCRIVAPDKHPNNKNKTIYTLTINQNKIEETIDTIKKGTFPLKDLSRSFYINPSTAIGEWLETYIFDMDHHKENLASPKSRILDVPYIKEKTGKKRKLHVYYDNYVPDIGYLYWFKCHNKDEAEYYHVFVEKFFLEADIRIFGAAYRPSNDQPWEPLKDEKGYLKD